MRPGRAISLVLATIFSGAISWMVVEGATPFILAMNLWLVVFAISSDSPTKARVTWTASVSLIVFLTTAVVLFSGSSWSVVSVNNAASIPSLHKGDNLLCREDSLPPDWGELAMIKHPDGTAFLGVPIGLPGDRVFFDGETIRLNNTKLRRSPIRQLQTAEHENLGLFVYLKDGRYSYHYKLDSASPPPPISGTVSLDEDQYFVLALNTSTGPGLDSRTTGAVPSRSLHRLDCYHLPTLKQPWRLGTEVRQ